MNATYERMYEYIYEGVSLNTTRRASGRGLEVAEPCMFNVFVLVDTSPPSLLSSATYLPNLQHGMSTNVCSHDYILLQTLRFVYSSWLFTATLVARLLYFWWILINENELLRLLYRLLIADRALIYRISWVVFSNLIFFIILPCAYNFKRFIKFRQTSLWWSLLAECALKYLQFWFWFFFSVLKEELILFLRKGLRET